MTERTASTAPFRIAPAADTDADSADPVMAEREIDRFREAIDDRRDAGGGTVVSNGERIRSATKRESSGRGITPANR